jgi:hypothetical protein
MALENRETGNYITILGGKFCQRVKDGTEGAVKRTNKIGKVVSEKFYDSFTARLIDIKITDGEYGKAWNFYFQDTKEVYILQLSYNNSLANTLLKILPNVDLTKELKLSPSQKEENGKIKTSLFVNQDGVALKHYYSKEHPNGLPQWTQIVVKGEKVWDSTDQLVFLENMVMTTIKPKLVGSKVEAQTTQTVEEPVELDTEKLEF